jgi:hypothetical protein
MESQANPEHEHPTPTEKAFGAHARSQQRQATEHDRDVSEKPAQAREAPRPAKDDA